MLTLVIIFNLTVYNDKSTNIQKSFIIRKINYFKLFFVAQQEQLSNIFSMQRSNY